MSTVDRQAVLRILTDISYNHCPTAQASEAVDLAKTMVAVMHAAERNCTDCRFKILAKAAEDTEDDMK